MHILYSYAIHYYIMKFFYFCELDMRGKIMKILGESKKDVEYVYCK